MPRGRLNEKHVQQAAVNWLASYYRDKVNVQAAVAEKEVVVRAKSKLGWGRADGLIAAQKTDGTVHTAALEAKSARTLLNMSPWYDDERWVLHAAIAGALGLLLAGLVG